MKKKVKQTLPGNNLRRGGDTYDVRNKVYGDNFKRVGAVMAGMFPNGVVLRTAEDHERYHLFELKIVKLTRFAVSGLVHIDSIHDDMVYSSMVESLITPGTAALKAPVDDKNPEGRI